MSECWIGWGSNVGDERLAFDAAWSLLRAHPQIQLGARSGLYRAAPVGQSAGGEFLNAVCGLSTTLAPLELLDLLQAVELRLGRTYDVRWGPRPIDLDLLFVNDLIIQEPRLTVPHPGAWYRRFVLDPLIEVAPTLCHPVLNATLSDLRSRLQVRPLVIAVQEALCVGQIEKLVAARFPDVRLSSPANPLIRPVAGLRLDETDPPGPTWHDVPVADLTATPDEPVQRIVDFLTSVLDKPQRVADW